MLINDMLQQICENQDIIHSAYYGKFLNSAFQEWFRIFNFIRKPGFNKNLWGYQLWMEKISRWFYYQREKPIKEWGNFPYIEQLDWNNLRESIQNITSKMDFELIHNFHFFDYNRDMQEYVDFVKQYNNNQLYKPYDKKHRNFVL